MLNIYSMLVAIVIVEHRFVLGIDMMKLLHHMLKHAVAVE